eukprot:CAMPEP_0206204970 /NCGR_PEP_ID=MMETSP0166-20121206/13894_1 /ASSEMBLY_ACC=CAM_ASM_000260 /TAXON_ID=95228 /ORGANISM="Vannella robusta, Strain DIVA3 518/3/11/1/6" /LENGTH=227 /DNA_ID=CAMNT_0053624805 /DNA_START=34 /DNA_END=714 /DNA_ORIENTATION=-
MSFITSGNRDKKKQSKKHQSLRKKEMIAKEQKQISLETKRNLMEVELGLTPPAERPQNEGLSEFLHPFELWHYHIEVTICDDVAFSMSQLYENSRKVYLQLNQDTTLEIIEVDYENKCILFVIEFHGNKEYKAIVARHELIFASHAYGKMNLNTMAALYSLFPFNLLDKLKWNEDLGWTGEPNAMKTKLLNQSCGQVAARYCLPSYVEISHKGEDWVRKGTHGQGQW